MGISRRTNDCQPNGAGFRFNALEIDPRSGLVSGPGGRETLAPRVMDVLALLNRRAGQVVTREQILAELWPQRVVTDDAVNRCIYLLRKQLSRAADDQRYRSLIETLPKRGYRLHREMPRLGPQSGNRALSMRSRHPWLMALAFVSLWFA
jgi:DNA-binding winged helix-turn-helix (wHTH) protein